MFTVLLAAKWFVACDIDSPSCASRSFCGDVHHTLGHRDVYCPLDLGHHLYAISRGNVLCDLGPSLGCNGMLGHTNWSSAGRWCRNSILRLGVGQRRGSVSLEPAGLVGIAVGRSRVAVRSMPHA